MDEQTLLLVSISVFGLMVMGLVLAVREFQRLESEEEAQAKTPHQETNTPVSDTHKARLDRAA